jgi:hypothetical protein
MEELFNKKRLPQVTNFIGSLGKEWLAMTNKQIRSKYFNNSRSFTDETIKILEEKSIIEVDRSVDSKTYIDGKWVMNSNRYRLFNGTTPKVISEKVFFGEDEGRTIRFKYKGIYDVTEIFKESDKSISRSVKEELGNLIDETTFISRCIELGLSKEKSWFLYTKIVNSQVVKLL